MLGRRIVGWLAGTAFALLAAGCQSAGGGNLASGGGPSPDFGHRAPSQTEPPVEDAPAARKTARTSKPADTLDDDSSEASPKSANRRPGWRGGKEQEPAERKPLPVSDTADSPSDELEM